MISLSAKLTCDNCGKEEACDISVKVICPIGYLPSMVPDSFPPKWRLVKLLCSGKGKLICSEECADVMSRM